MNLSDNEIYALIENAQNTTTAITESIEAAYVEATSLKFKYFWLQIEQLNGYNIADISEEKVPEFLLSKSKISLKSLIKCNADSCENLLSKNDMTYFKKDAQQRL